MPSLHKLSTKQRQQFIKDNTDSDLKHITNTSFDVDITNGRNCENVIGTTQLPLGIAGPLEIELHKKSLKTFIPLATTEGALVASVSRGCKAINQNGGAKTYVESKGATRGPYIEVKDIQQGRDIINWIDTNWSKLQELAKQTEIHTQLLNWDYQLLGKTLYLRFNYDTSEAMGMNMVTMATETILQELAKHFKLSKYAVSGNYCIDKKPSFLTLQQGRGKQVWAEAIIKKEDVKTILKTTPQDIVSVVHNKHHLGSAIAGSLGYNAHAANIIAALYIATGQDPAHVVEGSLTVTTASLEGEDLYVSVYLPAVMVGTIGGGTWLPTQQEALQILNLKSAQKGSAHQLAAMVASAVLAGELSLTAAIASRDLGKAHQQLGRKIV